MFVLCIWNEKSEERKLTEILRLVARYPIWGLLWLIWGEPGGG